MIELPTVEMQSPVNIGRWFSSVVSRGIIVSVDVSVASVHVV